jgi:putative NADH-flavin reductase
VRQAEPATDRKSDLDSRCAAAVPGFQREGPDRVIVPSAFGVGDTLAMASAIQRTIYKTALRPLFEDKARADAIRRSDHLAWTLVYAVTLTGKLRSGTYQASEAVRLKGMSMISRADVAAFMLAQANDTEWVSEVISEIFTGCTCARIA